MSDSDDMDIGPDPYSVDEYQPSSNKRQRSDSESEESMIYAVDNTNIGDTNIGDTIIGDKTNFFISNTPHSHTKVPPHTHTKLKKQKKTNPPSTSTGPPSLQQQVFLPPSSAQPAASTPSSAQLASTSTGPASTPASTLSTAQGFTLGSTSTPLPPAQPKATRKLETKEEAERRHRLEEREKYKDLIKKIILNKIDNPNYLELLSYCINYVNTYQRYDMDKFMRTHIKKHLSEKMSKSTSDFESWIDIFIDKADAKYSARQWDPIITGTKPLTVERFNKVFDTGSLSFGYPFQYLKKLMEPMEGMEGTEEMEEMEETEGTEGTEIIRNLYKYYIYQTINSYLNSKTKDEKTFFIRPSKKTKQKRDNNLVQFRNHLLNTYNTYRKRQHVELTYKPLEEVRLKINDNDCKQMSPPSFLQTLSDTLYFFLPLESHKDYAKLKGKAESDIAEAATTDTGVSLQQQISNINGDFNRGNDKSFYIFANFIALNADLAHDLHESTFLYYQECLQSYLNDVQLGDRGSSIINASYKEQLQLTRSGNDNGNGNNIVAYMFEKMFPKAYSPPAIGASSSAVGASSSAQGASSSIQGASSSAQVAPQSYKLTSANQVKTRDLRSDLLETLWDGRNPNSSFKFKNNTTIMSLIDFYSEIISIGYNGRASPDNKIFFESGTKYLRKEYLKAFLESLTSQNKEALKLAVETNIGTSDFNSLVDNYDANYNTFFNITESNPTNPYSWNKCVQVIDAGPGAGTTDPEVPIVGKQFVLKTNIGIVDCIVVTRYSTGNGCEHLIIFLKALGGNFIDEFENDDYKNIFPTDSDSPNSSVLSPAEYDRFLWCMCVNDSMSIDNLKRIANEYIDNSDMDQKYKFKHFRGKSSTSKKSEEKFIEVKDGSLFSDSIQGLSHDVFENNHLYFKSPPEDLNTKTLVVLTILYIKTLGDLLYKCASGIYSLHVVDLLISVSHYIHAILKIIYLPQLNPEVPFYSVAEKISNKPKGSIEEDDDEEPVDEEPVDGSPETDSNVMITDDDPSPETADITADAEQEMALIRKHIGESKDQQKENQIKEKIFQELYKTPILKLRTEDRKIIRSQNEVSVAVEIDMKNLAKLTKWPTNCFCNETVSDAVEADGPAVQPFEEQNVSRIHTFMKEMICKELEQRKLTPKSLGDFNLECIKLLKEECILTEYEIKQILDNVDIGKTITVATVNAPRGKNYNTSLQLKGEGSMNIYDEYISFFVLGEGNDITEDEEPGKKAIKFVKEKIRDIKDEYDKKNTEFEMTDITHISQLRPIGLPEVEKEGGIDFNTIPDNKISNFSQKLFRITFKITLELLYILEDIFKENVQIKSAIRQREQYFRNLIDSRYQESQIEPVAETFPLLSQNVEPEEEKEAEADKGSTAMEVEDIPGGKVRKTRKHHKKKKSTKRNTRRRNKSHNKTKKKTKRKQIRKKNIKKRKTKRKIKSKTK